MKIEFPENILHFVEGMECSRNEVGRSNATVYHFSDKDKEYYLKVEKTNDEFNREQKILKWLEDKLPVPKILVQCEKDGYEYLLMTKAQGEMTCSNENLNNPENTIKLLAKGIKMLQSVNIAECPFDNYLDKKLDNARSRIENNEIDEEDWEKGTNFRTPIELYEYLVKNKPEEELVFTHGDYCLPNIFVEGDNVSGFIDLGRAGVADKWQDIALCVRSIEHNFKNKDYIELLFKCLEIEPDYEKINYYILLDELF